MALVAQPANANATIDNAQLRQTNDPIISEYPQKHCNSANEGTGKAATHTVHLCLCT